MARNSPIWTRHHHNAIAKEIRELFPTKDNEYGFDELTRIMSKNIVTYQRGVLTALALNLAKRFAEDNDRFDPLIFLDACSPNVDLYPLSELWEEYARTNATSDI